MTDEATAFVPGHVTGFFSAHPDEDPAVAGSRGAGVTLTDGVRVTVRRDERGGDDGRTETDPEAGAATRQVRSAAVTLNGERVGVAPVGGVLDALGVDEGRVSVAAETPLPVGAGFGVSGAVALGVAFGANVLFGRGRSENELVTVAHRAEVEAGTGLGDVVAQARGGLPIRLDPGAPGHGALDGIPERPRVEYVTFGELSTAAVLSGDTTALTAAGESALEDLREEPTASRMVALSRRFAREAGLLTDRVADAIDDVRAAGGDASMAMLGETVFAFGTGLSDAGYDPEVCDVHTAGAGLLPGE
ncbi:pantoate kinase [Halopelagius longus]|uniref:Pantoate kinase n=1 Tax=Halopelagius longus TaxID=1236180 RepID=A0A1H1DEY0_9EURY|nr:pantoate kinase [Halopelagius longus]RDI71296.1 sugar kinase [Halopelagius longus]SDQ74799.1 pantothenate kinase [Halopelagius longus]